jgi:hypothetical protein
VSFPGPDASRDRDLAVERLLRAVKAGAIAPDTTADDPACPDAGMLAAWADGSLTTRELATVQTHAAGCARCQSTVAALLRAMPPPEIAAPWWRRRWVMAGLVPVTAGSLAIALWVAVPRNGVGPATESLAEQRSGPPVSAPPAPDTPSAGPPSPRLADQPPAPVEPEAAARENAAPRQPERAPATAPGSVAAARDGVREEATDARRDEAQSQAKSAAPTPPAPPAPAFAPSASPSVTLQRQAFAVAEVASPDPSIRWRIGAGGSIQRTSDGGGTWEPQSSGVTNDLTAAAAPSASVCWIVGRGGTVLVTTDGRSWRRVAFPEPVDLTAVQAADALTASVTAADRRRFRTGDGGQTWSLQEF